MIPPLNLLQQTVNHVVARLDSLDISQYIAELPEDTEEAIGAFCDRFELGNWFYDALILNEADVGAMLARIARERMGEEAEDTEERRVREYELQN